MTEITLQLIPENALVLEYKKPQLRLIVLSNNKILGCRKVALTAFSKYLLHPVTPPFKGRLQVSCDTGELLISVTGSTIGRVPLPKVLNVLKKFSH